MDRIVAILTFDSFEMRGPMSVFESRPLPTYEKRNEKEKKWEGNEKKTEGKKAKGRKRKPSTK